MRKLKVFLMVALLSLIVLIIQPPNADAAVIGGRNFLNSPSGKVLFKDIPGNNIPDPVIKPGDYYPADPNAPTTTIRFGAAFQGQEITKFYDQLCHDNRARQFCLDGKPNNPLTLTDNLTEALFGNSVHYGVYLRKGNDEGRVDGDQGLASILFDDDISSVSFDFICTLENGAPSGPGQPLRSTSGAEAIAFARDGKQLAKVQIAPKTARNAAVLPPPDTVSFSTTSGADEIAAVQVIMHRSEQSTNAAFRIEELSFVIKGQSENKLKVAGTIPAQSATTTGSFDFTIPGNIFDPDSGLSFSAKLSNGQPLPGWLTFPYSGNSRRFFGSPKSSDKGTYTITVTATNSSTGESVSTNFTLTVT